VPVAVREMVTPLERVATAAAQMDRLQ